MKFCEECGAQLEDDALFCEECGAPVESDAQQSGEETLNKADTETTAETDTQESGSETSADTSDEITAEVCDAPDSSDEAKAKVHEAPDPSDEPDAGKTAAPQKRLPAFIPVGIAAACILIVIAVIMIQKPKKNTQDQDLAIDTQTGAPTQQQASTDSQSESTLTVDTATAEPTTGSTPAQTMEPTAAPTTEPTAAPTAEPTIAPTTEPTVAPTAVPTAVPTVEPTIAPTAAPSTEVPTAVPTTPPAATILPIDPTAPMPAFSPTFSKPYDTALYDAESGLWLIGDTIRDYAKLQITYVSTIILLSDYLNFEGAILNIGYRPIYNAHVSISLVTENGDVIDTQPSALLHTHTSSRNGFIPDSGFAPEQYVMMYTENSDTAPRNPALHPQASPDPNDPLYLADYEFHPHGEGFFYWDQAIYDIDIPGNKRLNPGHGQCHNMGIPISGYSVPIYGIYISLASYQTTP